MEFKNIKNLFSICKTYYFRSLILAIECDNQKISYLHYMWSKYNCKSNTSILWCYDKFTYSKNQHIFKTKKKLHKAQAESVNVRYCYYKQIKKIIGNTFGFCVLENFESLDPNILAKIIEMIEGGGLVIFLFNKIQNLNKIYHFSKDVYKTFDVKFYNKTNGRFVERFVFSLKSCFTFLSIDRRIKPNFLSQNNIKLQILYKKIHRNLTKNKTVFFLLIKNMKKIKPLGILVEKTKTFDQARALLALTEAISNKKTITTVILTSARGRGKSAVLGLATSAAIAYGYGNIFISSLDPENLNIYFAFVLIGLKSLKYEENIHFQIIQDFKLKFIAKIKICCTHEQFIIFLFPYEIKIFEKQIELLIIDEVASMTMSILESTCGLFSTFMSTTTCGYEGTGRYVNIKLIKKFKNKFKNKQKSNQNLFIFQEIVLNEPIRYSLYDPVEKWLNNFLCLDNDLPLILSHGCPTPKYCKLFLIDRNALFFPNKLTNYFLQKIISILTSIHYKNSPNDLQMLCDAPSHRILILINLLTISIGNLPDILGVLHISHEGRVSKRYSNEKMVKRVKISGDLVPWIISGEFLDPSFTEMSSIRIVRIAVHPDIQNIGYGSKIVKSLCFFLENNKSNKFRNFSKKLNVIFKNKVPILIDLNYRTFSFLDYISTSFEMTHSLFYFWNKNNFKLIFIRNQINSRYASIMLYLFKKKNQKTLNWIKNYQLNFLENFLNRLNTHFKKISSSLIFSIVQNIQFENLHQATIRINIKDFFDDMIIYKIFFFTKNFFFQYRILSELFFHLIKILIWNQFQNKNFLLSEIFLLISLGLQNKKVNQILTEFNWTAVYFIQLTKNILKKFTSIVIYKKNCV